MAIYPVVHKDTGEEKVVEMSIHEWDQWKEDVASELDDHVETQDELNELMEYIRKENIGEICKDIFEGAAENLTNEKHENGEWESN